MTQSTARAEGASASVLKRRRQAGAIPYRIAGSGPEVMLVTSRSGGAWILPKGNIDPGSTPASTARIEALEEAGVVRSPWAEPVGNHDYEKESEVPLTVAVLALKVDQVLATRAESSLRRRRRVSLEEAMRLVAEPGVRAVLSLFLERLRHGE